MSNLYDKTHELARLIEEEEIYQIVRRLTEKLRNEPEKMQQIESFRMQQYELQSKQMQGLPLGADEMEKVTDYYKNLTKDLEIKQLLEAEEQLSRLFMDLNRILTGPLEKIYKK